MTLLLVIISVTNIAIGYGLAIYLGHLRVSRTPVVREVRPQSEARQPQSVEQPPREEAAPAAPEAAPAAAVEPVAESSLVASVEASAPAEMVEPAASAAEGAAELPEEPAEANVAETTVAAPTEEELLDKVEEVRAEIHDAAEPATMVEALASETDPASPESASEAPPADPQPVSQEALLESINTFQAQLKKQQELATLHGVKSKSP